MTQNQLLKSCLSVPPCLFLEKQTVQLMDGALTSCYNYVYIILFYFKLHFDFISYNKVVLDWRTCNLLCGRHVLGV